ncbi:integrase catalytic domain-containing protein [Trichonephila clavipes]|uniref:Integrase catalytic domain-containing protein n=1 Tax=Trichonephila clavipes TaxID=2585209 RepID=A0A8X6VT57_TRICX|nr:integrase catalytic domain-containing protein [Trichonephila clavipes]
MSKQRMGDLSKDRVTLKRPFYCCGIDYAGPVSVLKYRGRGAKTTKGYIVKFVCFATKALHLELVSDYTSETFIAALKRFCSRRSTPKHIHSDNGTNFIGAKRKLGQLFKHLSKITNEEKVCYFLSQQEIEWHTIPPLSSHFGGLWEAGVKSVKFNLKRVLGSINLTFEEFYTLLTQMEMVLNSRPLVRLVDNDIDSLNVRTPSHFLVGEEIIGSPETVEESKLALKGRWEDNVPPSVWPLEKVISTHPGEKKETIQPDIFLCPLFAPMHWISVKGFHTEAPSPDAVLWNTCYFAVPPLLWKSFGLSYSAA